MANSKSHVGKRHNDALNRQFYLFMANNFSILTHALDEIIEGNAANFKEFENLSFTFDFPI